MGQLIRTLKGHIRDEIIKKGGWVNSHAHADRAFTMTQRKLPFIKMQTSNKNGI